MLINLWWIQKMSRYPNFSDALQDLDDCLTMISLFAVLPTGPKIHKDDVEMCSRLVKEWQTFVVQTRALRKVFVKSHHISLFFFFVHAFDFLTPSFYIQISKSLFFFYINSFVLTSSAFRFWFCCVTSSLINSFIPKKKTNDFVNKKKEMRNKFCSTYLLFLTCDFLQSDENFVKPTVNIFLCIHVKLWRILNGIGSVQLQQNELHQNFVKFHKVCHDTIINIFGQLGKKKIEKMSLLKIEN